MRHFLRHSLSPLLFAAAVTLGSGTGFCADKDLSAMIESVRKKYNLPAAGAAVVKNGKIVGLGVAGTRVLGMDLPVEKDDRFHLGSNSKALTATVAGILVDEGKLSWDSTLGEVLGTKVPGMNPKLAAVTLGQLLSNSSGIPSDTEEMVNIYFNTRNYDHPQPELRLMALEEYKNTEPVVPSGSPFQYSNFGFMLAAAMIDEAAKVPTENLYLTKILRPLGLASAGFGPQATTGLYDAPVGHFTNPDETITPRLWGENADVPSILFTVGGVHMNMADYARWAAWNAGGGRRGPSLIKPETLAYIQAEKVRTPERPNPPPGTPKSGGYAFAWSVLKYDWAPNEVLQHNGSNSMNLAKILVDPTNDLAVVCATNIGGRNADAAMGELERTLYLEFLGRSPDGQKTQAEQIRQAVKQVMEDASLRSAIFRVTVGGRPLVTEAYGESEDGVKATTKMHFRNGAVAIAYMANLTLQLHDSKVIDLDDPVGKWLPELPNANTVTLRMLLDGTSGYPDYVRNQGFIDAFYADVYRQWTPRELLEWAFQTEPLFPPGTDWSYAHTNFVALGLALERATGRPLRDLIRSKIMFPWQLNDTANPNTPEITRPILHAFTKERGTYEEATFWSPSWTLARGAIMTTNIFDMERSARLIGKGSLISKRSFRAMLAPTTAGMGPFTDDTYYGLGIVVNNGWLLQNPRFHGWSGVMAYFPEGDISVAVVSTKLPGAEEESNDSSAILRKIAEILTPGNLP
jgi:CubicO group peptidase (beta-lactamase class C family)